MLPDRNFQPPESAERPHQDEIDSQMCRKLLKKTKTRHFLAGEGEISRNYNDDKKIITLGYLK
jgi:hypothetical protein